MTYRLKWSTYLGLSSSVCTCKRVSNMWCFWKVTISQALCFVLANGESSFWGWSCSNLNVVTMGINREPLSIFLWQIIRKLITRYFVGTTSLGMQIYFLSRLLQIHFKLFQILYQFDCKNVKKKFMCRLSIEYTENEFSGFFFQCIFHLLVCKRWVLLKKKKKKCWKSLAWPGAHICVLGSLVSSPIVSSPRVFPACSSCQDPPRPGWGGHCFAASTLFRGNRPGPHSSTAPHPQPLPQSTECTGNRCGPWGLRACPRCFVLNC